MRGSKVKVHLITEDLDLTVGSVQGFVAAVVVAVGVDLYHQRKTLHPLLRGEVCAKTVHRDEDLPIRTQDKFHVKIHVKQTSMSIGAKLFATGVLWEIVMVYVTLEHKTSHK